MSAPLHTVMMQKIAVHALDEALAKAALPRAGLFLMSHARAVEETGCAVWEYLRHVGAADEPIALATAVVDRMTGEVSVRVSPDGHAPWRSGQKVR